MTLTRELRTTIAFVLAMVFALTAFVWGNQRLVHANPVDVGQILCFVDQAGNALDGDTGTFPVFKLDNCGSGSPIVDWCPNLPGNQAQSELPCTPPDTDWCPNIPGTQPESDLPCIPPAVDLCPNIDGLQATVPEGKVLESGMCVDANNGGGGTGADLAITKAVSDTSPTPSSTIVYTITVTSNGPASATNVKVTDTLPAGVSLVSNDSNGAFATSTGIWTIGTMASGTTATLNLTVTVMATSGVEVLNTATISGSDSTDPNTGNNTATVSFTSTTDGQGGGNGSPQCSDGIDNDGDGEIDYPADGDCESASDDKEEADRRSSGGSRRSSSNGSSNNNNGEVLGAQTECPMYLTGYIKQGAANDAGEVAKLQVFINAYEANSLQVSGIYDAPTVAAVNAFQRKYAADVLEPWGLTGTTGYVYYTTQKQINTIYCEFLKDFPLSVSQIEEIAYVREIQPQLRAQGVTSMGTTQGVTAGAATVKATSPAVGSVVLPTTKTDENANASTTASSTSASSTPGWFGRFVNWLFGR